MIEIYTNRLDEIDELLKSGPSKELIEEKNKIITKINLMLPAGQVFVPVENKLEIQVSAEPEVIIKKFHSNLLNEDFIFNIENEAIKFERNGKAIYYYKNELESLYNANVCEKQLKITHKLKWLGDKVSFKGIDKIDEFNFGTNNIENYRKVI